MNTWYVPVLAPRSSFDNPDPATVLATHVRFHAVWPDHLVIWEENDKPELPIRWVCYSCYEACGNRDDCFSTTPEPLKNLTGGVPTLDQQQQMSEHARQHSIIWGWARKQDQR